MFRRILVLLAVSATAAAGLVAIQSTAPDPQNDLPAAQAANGAEFNPGNIISDENFYDGDAMTVDEVQAFLVSKNSSTASTALRNYTQATPSMPATQYCQAYQGAAGGESAASIIAKVGQACNFSQKAMLVLLEKEQSLLSLSSPSTGRLAAATGFGCPDTAPCDQSYGGFFYQVYNAARQFQYYKANPYSFNHIPGATNNVLYNPNYGCGSSAVFIENSATAGLYNYTPYQPNRAALNNLYGEGDGCSAYGNRNFWWMYTDWFGDTHAASDRSALMRGKGTNEVYLVTEGTKYYVSADIYPTLKRLGNVVDVPAEEISAMPEGPWASDRMVTTDGTPVLLGDDGKYWNFRGCQVFAAYGADCDNAAKISPAQLGKFTGGWTLESFVQTLDGRLLLIQNGEKRELSNLDVFTKMGYFTATTILADHRLDYLPYGTPIVAGGGIVTGDGGEAPLAVDTANVGHVIPQTMSGLAAYKPTSTFTSESYAKIAQGEALAARMTDGQGSYVATSEGLLRVNAANFGADAAWTQVSPEAIASVKDAGSSYGPTFFHPVGSDAISLVAGGERTEFVDTKAVEAEATKRGISSTVYPAAIGALNGVAVGNGITNGTLLKPQGKDDLYLLDGMYLQPVKSKEVAAALGFTQSPITITTASFENIEQRSTTLSGTQVSCGDQVWFASEGKRYLFGSPELAASFGLETQTLSPELCGLVPQASTGVSDFLRDTDSRQVFWISGGEKRYVTTYETIDAMGGIDRGIIEASPTVLEQFPKGADLTSPPADYVPPAGVTPPTQEPAPTTPAPAPTQTPTPAPTESTQPTPTATEEPAVPLESGDVITNTAGTGVWIVNGDRLLQVGSAKVAADLGLAIDAPQTVPQANFDAFRGKTAPLYTSAVRCGDVDYIGIDGELVPYASGEVAAAYGLDHTALAPEVCATLTVSTTAQLGLAVTTADGKSYVVESGKLRLNEQTTSTPSETPVATGDAEPTSTEPAPTATEGSGVPAADGASATPTPTPTGTTPQADDASATGEPEATATEEPVATPEPTETQVAALLVLPQEIVTAMGKGAPIGA